MCYLFPWQHEISQLFDVSLFLYHRIILSDSRWRLVYKMVVEIQRRISFAFSNIFSFRFLPRVCIFVSNMNQGQISSYSTPNENKKKIVFFWILRIISKNLNLDCHFVSNHHFFLIWQNILYIHVAGPID
jgi:hypothetical protein